MTVRSDAERARPDPDYPYCPSCGLYEGVHSRICPIWLPEKKPTTAPPPASLEERVRDWEERLGSRIGSGEALGPLVLALVRAEVAR